MGPATRVKSASSWGSSHCSWCCYFWSPHDRQGHVELCSDFSGIVSVAAAPPHAQAVATTRCESGISRCVVPFLIVHTTGKCFRCISEVAVHHLEPLWRYACTARWTANSVMLQSCHVVK